MKKKSKTPEPNREAIAVARVLCGMNVEVDIFPEPLASVIRDTLTAPSKKLDAFKKSAKARGLQDADVLLTAAKSVDPSATPSEDPGLDLITADAILGMVQVRLTS